MGLLQSGILNSDSEWAMGRSELEIRRGEGRKLLIAEGFEYAEFLENFFANIDDEDRYGEVNLKTAQSFRICADLIEVFKNWDEIDFEWIKKCNFNFI